MTNLYKVMTAALMLSVTATILVAQEPVHSTHEGPSVSIPADQIKFVHTGVKTEKGELMAGPAYGDLQHGRHGTFVRMPHGFKSVVHTHTEDYYAAVIEGVGSNHPVGGRALRLPKGSYWFQRGEEPHVTECLSKTDCLFFLVQPGKFDYAPVR